MFGRERSLVQRLDGKSFVLLGVNADESPEQLNRIQESAQLNWLSWWDGPGGAIAASWGVDRYPAFFLLDQQGVVRWREFGVPREGLLERKIEELLREAG